MRDIRGVYMRMWGLLLIQFGLAKNMIDYVEDEREATSRSIGVGRTRRKELSTRNLFRGGL